jgi:hypothetical protein
MADQGYWMTKTGRPRKPALAIGHIVIVGGIALGLGLAAAEWGPPFLGELIPGQDVVGVVVTAIFLGLVAAVLGWGLLEGLSRIQRRERPELFAWLILAPAGVAGAIVCAFALPGPLDDRLTDARVSDSWGHYVDTLSYDESHLQSAMNQLALDRVLDPSRLGERGHWQTARDQIRMGHEIVAKFRGYELHRRDEALKTVAEGGLRVSAQAKARKRIEDGYTVLAPLFASRWDILDAQMALYEKAADLMQSSPGGWQIEGGRIMFNNRRQYEGLNRLIERSRELQSQQRSVECKLNNALRSRRSPCDEV